MILFSCGGQHRSHDGCLPFRAAHRSDTFKGNGAVDSLNGMDSKKLESSSDSPQRSRLSNWPSSERNGSHGETKKQRTIYQSRSSARCAKSHAGGQPRQSLLPRCASSLPLVGRLDVNIPALQGRREQNWRVNGGKLRMAPLRRSNPDRARNLSVCLNSPLSVSRG